MCARSSTVASVNIAVSIIGHQRFVPLSHCHGRLLPCHRSARNKLTNFIDQSSRYRSYIEEQKRLRLSTAIPWPLNTSKARYRRTTKASDLIDAGGRAMKLPMTSSRTERHQYYDSENLGRRSTRGSKPSTTQDNNMTAGLQEKQSIRREVLLR